MNEMTLSYRHRTRDSSPGGVKPSTLPLGHGGSPQYWFLHVDGEETFLFFFKPLRPGTDPRTVACKAAVLTTTLGPPPSGWAGGGVKPSETNWRVLANTIKHEQNCSWDWRLVESCVELLIIYSFIMRFFVFSIVPLFSRSLIRII